MRSVCQYILLRIFDYPLAMAKLTPYRADIVADTLPGTPWQMRAYPLADWR